MGLVVHLYSRFNPAEATPPPARAVRFRFDHGATALFLRQLNIKIFIFALKY
jgi:hypothetical protein